MASKRQWFVRSLWAVLIGVPLVVLALYAINPSGVQSLDPRARILGYSPYRVGSSGMASTLQAEQVVVIRARNPRGELKRGDIVAFRGHDGSGHVWLQRIVGLPGESLAIEEGRLVINGKLIEEPYVEPGRAETDYSRDVPATQIPAGHYYLLGDNRDNSEDCRMHAPVPGQDIIGVTAQALPPPAE